MAEVWLKGEYEFAALFSYRIPNFSPSYAPSAPLPGPSAVKLALVSTRIETTGEVVEGERLFEVVGDAAVGLEPPLWLTTSRVFLRRLKRMKDGSIDESFGVREYVHHSGPVGLYVEVEVEAAKLVAETMRRLRRIGTSDSLLRCVSVRELAPDPTLIARPLKEFTTRLDVDFFARRPVIQLRDIQAGTEFRKVSPYERTRGDFTEARTYIFPLRLDQQGEGWKRYRREPFE